MDAGKDIPWKRTYLRSKSRKESQDQMKKRQKDAATGSEEARLTETQQRNEEQSGIVLELSLGLPGEQHGQNLGVDSTRKGQEQASVGNSSGNGQEQANEGRSSGKGQGQVSAGRRSGKGKEQVTEGNSSGNGQEQARAGIMIFGKLLSP